ncbi:MarR family transcriptional regulator [Aliidiomarina sedimenti]|uniref:MarR family transcriptional regulator n=1 Tax=Aliidiomarina sedimenti TaxID=1933879 RepID=A0ABY0BXT0_9GAMM|nr:MarR family transcriptional regulator [Aliidiomarina sedimenti]RUO29249.1 MarR family transcriptional regulator [Aliidiomarina sedimenti]
MRHPQLLLDNQLCHRIYMANHNLNRVYSSLLEPLQLTYPQYVVMMALWQQDQITLSQLSERTRIDAGTLSLMVRKLTDKNLIDVRPGKDDKRQRVVHLTEPGQALADQASNLPDQVLCAFPTLDQDELKTLAQLLDKLNQA